MAMRARFKTLSSVVVMLNMISLLSFQLRAEIDEQAIDACFFRSNGT